VRRIVQAPLAALLLFGLNAWIAWRLFWIEYTPAFSSIEGSFVGLARHLSRHGRDFWWWPIWHCGMPFQDTYLPLFHTTTAITTALLHSSAAHGYHAVIGFTYSLAAATVFLMARMLGARMPSALAAGLVFSLFSPSAFLVPEFGADLGNPLAGRRLQVLTVYGEGPHVTAIALIPIAILALEYALRRRTARSFALSALAVALVFLTNVPGSMALGLAVFCWLCAQAGDHRAAAWRIAAGAAALAYGLACFGVPPSSLSTVFGNVGPMHNGFSASLHHTPYLLPLLLLTVAAAGYGLARTSVPLFVRFGFLYFLVTTTLVFSARRSEVFELLPQAGRLHLELEMGAALVLAWGLGAAFEWRWTRYAVLIFGLAFGVSQFRTYRWRARMDLSPVNLEKHSEYTSARWLDANMGGRRVYATGSTGFWLNAFTDTPQMVGCCEQGRSMLALAGVPYLLNVGETPAQTELGIQWLQAMGVHALVVNGPQSDDAYKDFHKPERFASFLPVLHQERGDTIYAIPQKSPSMAHVLHPSEAAAARTAGVPDAAEVARYVAAIEDPSRPVAVCDWPRAGTAVIRSNLSANDEISVQTAWFRGWRASVSGRQVPVTEDGFGFLLIHPQCRGGCEVRLTWSGPWDFWPAALVSLASLGLVVWLLARHRYNG
jgi:hypothetical protein